MWEVFGERTIQQIIGMGQGKEVAHPLTTPLWGQIPVE